MASPTELMALGTNPARANALGQSLSNALTATGTTKAGALALKGGLNRFTTVGSGAGASLPPAVGAPITVVDNGGANALSVYTGNATDTINALSAGAAFSVTNAKVAIFVPSGNTWSVVLSA